MLYIVLICVSSYQGDIESINATVDEAPDHGGLPHQWRLTKYLSHNVYVAYIADVSLILSHGVDNGDQKVLEPNEIKPVKQRNTLRLGKFSPPKIPIYGTFSKTIQELCPSFLLSLSHFA